jgi:phage baseplate assembly protein W
MTAPLTTPAIRDIISADWSPKVGDYGTLVEGIDDIAQCVGIILQTPKGSVPHRPDFGCDLWNYLDRPLAQVRPLIVRDALAAIAAFEPRCTVQSLTTAVDGDDPRHLTLTLTWVPTGGGLATTTVFSIGATS